MPRDGVKHDGCEPSKRPMERSATEGSVLWQLHAAATVAEDVLVVFDVGHETSYAQHTPPVRATASRRRGTSCVTELGPHCGLAWGRAREDYATARRAEPNGRTRDQRNICPH